MTRAQTPEPTLILLAVVALGFSCVITQLTLMRELLAAFSGNEMVLGIILGLWLLLMGIGTLLGRASGKLRDPRAWLVASLTLVAVLPLLQVFLLRTIRNVVFVRGAAVGIAETALSTFALLLPYCSAAGYALMLACAVLLRLPRSPEAIADRTADGSTVEAAPNAQMLTADPAGRRAANEGHREGSGNSRRRAVWSSAVPPESKAQARPPEGGTPNQVAGSVYIADSIGSILGGILFSFALVRWFDHIAILLFPAVLTLLMAAALGFRSGHKRQAFAAVVAAFGLSAATLMLDLDRISTSLQYPRQRVVARANSPYGRLLVVESDGQFDFIENGVPLTSTRDDQHVEETVHYAMAQRPDARKVLLVAGGISGTAKEILKYGIDEVDYVELDPLILQLGRKFLPDNLADNRIRIINNDGRLFLKQIRGQYDVIIVDVPDPSTAQLNRFYTAEFFAEVKHALSQNGILSFSLGHYENYVSPELARILASARRSVGQSFRNVRLIPGGQIFFLACDRPLIEDFVRRIEQQQIKTKLVNRHYLDAMLTADRMMDMERATAQTAGLNQDFSPVLYYYHLRHWMSQFTAGFGVLPVLVAGCLGVYLARLRAPAFTLFASGFAGTGLEMVLLLVFQILCGSVYYQVGIIVTVFMAGLAIGASLSNRFPRCARGDARSLACLALGIAVFALILVLLLPRLNRLPGTAASLFAIKIAVAALTFLLAALVGSQFPLANRIEFDGTVAGASRLYTADFLGAFLGALVVAAWLLPLIGLTGVCLLVAAVNLIACLMILFRKGVP